MRPFAFTTLSFATLALAGACSSSNPIKATNDGGPGGGDCSNAPALEQDIASCASCSFAANASPATCTASRPLNACCAWVQAPTQEIARGTGLHYFSSMDATINLGCLKTPAQAGASQMVTLQGYVKVFSSPSTNEGSDGVKVEVHKEGANGAVGALVGTFTTTTDDATDPAQMPLVTFLKNCPDGCKFRQYTIMNVPTETPLVIVTTDANNSNTWSPLYDYNVYFSNDSVQGGMVHYDASAVASTDLNTVSHAAGGFSIDNAKGLLAGEVHDCGDVRLSGAMVDTDQPHEGPMFYFSDNESDPLPDQTRAPAGLGTSKLGLFGALNIPAGPVKVSAVGKYQGNDVLLGTYVVQVFPGSVTALSLRGRRPFQQ